MPTYTGPTVLDIADTDVPTASDLAAERTNGLAPLTAAQRVALRTNAGWAA